MKKKIIILITIIVLCLICFQIIDTKQELLLNGKDEIYLNLNQPYHDDGVNMKNAKVSGVVNTNKEGTYQIKYSYKEQTITRTIHVVDQNRMVMNLNGSQETYVKKDDPYIESGCHVIDKKDGDVTHEVKIDRTVDTHKVGDYKVHYSITHNYLTLKKERIVHVVDDLEENTTGIPVLMYHYVYTKDDIPKKINVNYILDTKFEEQLQFLTKNHYYFPSYQELQAYVKKEISLPKKSVILTFDDGQKGFLKYGIPLLEKYKVPATSFVIGAKAENKISDYASEYISYQSHSYNMHIGGGNIGHGGIISTMNKNEIMNDLKKSQTIVQNKEAFAYPYGDVTEQAKVAVKEADILCSFTTQYGKVKQGADCSVLPRIRVFGNANLKSYIQSMQ